MENLLVPMEIKAVSDEGTFKGYASIFGNVDLGRDVVEPGAFKQFHKTRDGKIITLYSHDSFNNLPIGKSDVEQDEKGLKFEGQLVMDDPFVQRVHTHMKAGTLDGMSIGYSVLPGGSEFTEDGIRKLKKLKLHEISVVVFGMNPKARVTAVKSAAAGITTIREYEDFLRDAGFSNAQAKLLASGGFKAFQKHRDDGETELAAQNLLKAVENFSFPKITL